MKLLIYGSRSFASTVADLGCDCGHEVIGMMDHVNTGLGKVGTFDAAMEMFPGAGVVLAIGYHYLPVRWTAWQPVLASARVGAHSFIGAGAAVVDHGVVPASSYVRMLESYTRKEGL